MSCGLNSVSIIIPAIPNEPALEQLLQDLAPFSDDIIVSSEGTRAKSLNLGAEKASGSILWFLHADSRIIQENITALKQALDEYPHALHYFDLAFEGGGMTSLNAWGTNIRSRVFGLPYGDQGLCISKALFKTIGGYPEEAPYGEDFLFVRQAKRLGIKLHPISSKLTTSARKYKEQGWLKLTILRQWQLFKLMRVAL